MSSPSPDASPAADARPLAVPVHKAAADSVDFHNPVLTGDTELVQGPFGLIPPPRPPSAPYPRSDKFDTPQQKLHKFCFKSPWGLFILLAIIIPIIVYFAVGGSSSSSSSQRLGPSNGGGGNPDLLYGDYIGSTQPTGSAQPFQILFSIFYSLSFS